MYFVAINIMKNFKISLPNAAVYANQFNSSNFSIQEKKTFWKNQFYMPNIPFNTPKNCKYNECYG